MNTISLVGRLTKDPELRFTQNGNAVATLRLAIARRDKDADPVYLDVVTWNEQAKVCAEHLAKGRQVAVTGRLEDRHWETEDGQKRSTFEVVASSVDFLGSKDKGAETVTSAPEGEPS